MSAIFGSCFGGAVDEMGAHFRKNCGAQTADPKSWFAACVSDLLRAASALQCPCCFVPQDGRPAAVAQRRLDAGEGCHLPLRLDCSRTVRNLHAQCVESLKEIPSRVKDSGEETFTRARTRPRLQAQC
eukprot:1611440-Pleurochrysis_carterae.AAC.1